MISEAPHHSNNLLNAVVLEIGALNIRCFSEHSSCLGIEINRYIVCKKIKAVPANNFMLPATVSNKTNLVLKI